MNLKHKVKRFFRKYKSACWLMACVKCLKKPDEKLGKALQTFVAEEKRNNKVSINILKHDIYYCSIFYRISYDEYFLFDFPSLSDLGRKRFVGDLERIELCDSLTTEKTKQIFNNKFLTYETFKEFYKRNVIKITGKENYDEFCDYVSNHKKFMVKAISKSFGRGIYLVDTCQNGFDKDVIFDQILKDGECILEECIEQVDQLAQFHPKSCNTIRLTTYIKNDVVYPLYAFFRMGRGGSEVDNAGAGGIFASIDLNTGIVKTAGITETGVTYLRHPDTGTQIIGFQIPEWKELLQLVDRLAKLVPEQPYVGWDMALTSDGWVVVEGNCRGQFVQQYAEKAGCRGIVDELIRKS